MTTTNADGWADEYRRSWETCVYWTRLSAGRYAWGAELLAGLKLPGGDDGILDGVGIPVL